MKKDYKVCVYAICKNEMKFIDKWLDNMSEADYIVVLDTGSTDGTYEFLKKDKRVTRVEQKIFDPWRFDVARNESMKLVPDDTDIYVCTDPDELFEEGWCKPLKEGWTEDATRGTYLYAWSHSASGGPQDVFMYDKIHTKDYYWKYPIHEVLWRDDMENEVRLDFREYIYLHHYQDLSLDRKSYLDLLKLSVEENPEDAHVYHLYCREYYLQGDYETSKKLFYNIFRMPDTYQLSNKEVLLDSLLMQAGLCMMLEKEAEEFIYWIDQFLRIDDSFREPYLLYADFLATNKEYDLADQVLQEMYQKTFQHHSWVEKHANWLYQDKLIYAYIRYGQGRYKEAVDFIDECLTYIPDSPELLKLKIDCLSPHTDIEIVED